MKNRIRRAKRLLRVQSRLLLTERLELQTLKELTGSGAGSRTEGHRTVEPGRTTDDPFQFFGSQSCFLGGQD